MQENRKSSRIPSSEETMVAMDNGQKSGVKLIDISLGGMKILTDEKFPDGTSLTGKFNILPRIGPFYIKGEVAWTKPCLGKSPGYKFETGIKFTQINTIPI